MIPHVWGAAALIVNTFSAVGLLCFRSNPFAGSQLTADQMISVAPEYYRRYRRELVWYRISVAGIGVGFVFGLIDLLST